jgi:hypothetical protein
VWYVCDVCKGVVCGACVLCMCVVCVLCVCVCGVCVVCVRVWCVCYASVYMVCVCVCATERDYSSIFSAVSRFHKWNYCGRTVVCVVLCSVRTRSMLCLN